MKRFIAIAVVALILLGALVSCQYRSHLKIKYPEEALIEIDEFDLTMTPREPLSKGH